ncbi:zinc finger protein 628 [Drosophila grimshawi]|uniref:GH10172 n=1 Tax=Drosophila grimshawi TaxID=7222 RepID=B4JBX7_DROGR|nr:zinc finger protein 628 [Drosophila grimshawi]EDW04080.1 GH10172 [Drosophila grimshawi]
MPAHCAVVNCSDKYVHSGSISFHRFPFKRKDLLQKWKDFTQRSGQWMPSKWSAVCSRHFSDSDFNCSNNRKTLKKNAVPTLRLLPEDAESRQVEQQRQQQSAPAAATETPTSNCTKSTCRFCGNTAPNCVSFDKSFELFGMIQKCFPTLQILQDDTLPLPKDICGDCCRQLQRFSQFCDVVMLAQSELQRKYRRQLKIKQEPVVRVKQEACESLDNLFPDELDMGLDEACCDHEPEPHDETEQKFQFCDFNPQDIINNCDIMEIINLDDPFINITDDADVPQPVPVLPTAQELLQSELLTEEHNYAKEDWPLQQYKTEKVEGIELNEAVAPPPAAPAPSETRSCKPIVTNVSQIPNPMICELLPPPATSNKPNIVVLNDSVVQSSAFRLHDCSLCSTKFFTAESLQQHYAQAHGTPTETPPSAPPPPPSAPVAAPPPAPTPAAVPPPLPAPTAVPPQAPAPPAHPPPAPMVSVPPLNISLSSAGSSLKLEASSSLSLPAAAVDYWQADWWPAAQLPAKTKIDILDMQRSFLHCNDLIAMPPAVSHQQSVDVQPLAYAKLAARFRRLQHKCRQLRQQQQQRQHHPHPANHRLHCGRCKRGFGSVQLLLQHRRRRRHFVVPPQRTFAVRCFGCLRLFRTRLGLRQHMRYICQSLPLRNARLQSYKCRHCQSISFTHWRVYRRHELKCKQRQANSSSRNRHSGKRRRSHPVQRTHHSCGICQKIFGSLTGLKQHRITHSSERRYKCSICERVFKRRNGLSQHIRGYHMQFKPHECPVCQHRYALKGDMLRCRHSQRRGASANETEQAKTVQH